MAISISLLIISVFFLFCPSLSHRLISNRCPSYESQALLRFKAAFNDSYGSLSSWVNGTDCCTEWRGISCDNHTDHVVSVAMPEYPFQGVISESLCQLYFLTSLTISGVSVLDLSNNDLNGSIPSCLGNLASLTVLNLQSNQLSGGIPACLRNLSSLIHLDLSFNRLIGSIPAFLGNISSLAELNLSYNRLTGSIPASLGNLSSLDELHLIATTN